MATVTAPWGSAGLAPSAPVLCRLCGSVIALWVGHRSQASFATVGPITPHFECWITRVPGPADPSRSHGPASQHAVRTGTREGEGPDRSPSNGGPALGEAAPGADPVRRLSLLALLALHIGRITIEILHDGERLEIRERNRDDAHVWVATWQIGRSGRMLSAEPLMAEVGGSLVPELPVSVGRVIVNRAARSGCGGSFPPGTLAAPRERWHT
jgi:hypothetical protein